MRILLVEDDPMVGAAVRKGMQQDGHTVDWVRDAGAAEAALDAGAFEFMLLDLGLPGKSGLDLLGALRRAANPLPVIVCTARDAVSDRIRGLDLGADDYLVKPFALDELSARIKYDVRTIRERLKDSVLLEGTHYVRPFGGRKILFVWEAIERDMGQASAADRSAIPMANGGVLHG